jgi:hypothetical protein
LGTTVTATAGLGTSTFGTTTASFGTFTVTVGLGTLTTGLGTLTTIFGLGTTTLGLGIAGLGTFTKGLGISTARQTDAEKRDSAKPATEQQFKWDDVPMIISQRYRPAYSIDLIDLMSRRVFTHLG